ncbi:hypothetical protein SAMN05444921_101434 [Streptomyces wuyuanensis]|uniref:Uncharacterized protein n=1 Tax=Streptomyces wuyuanensis TaxID=1196353 RepID=A0A1G9N3Z0_9ACTN|nr:hypothetical protein SAMN05444921_101434 [Streptomyces wuyuanensis]
MTKHCRTPLVRRRPVHLGLPVQSGERAAVPVIPASRAHGDR